MQTNKLPEYYYEQKYKYNQIINIFHLLKYSYIDITSIFKFINLLLTKDLLILKFQEKDNHNNNNQNNNNPNNNNKKYPILYSKREVDFVQIETKIEFDEHMINNEEMIKILNNKIKNQRIINQGNVNNEKIIKETEDTIKKLDERIKSMEDKGEQTKEQTAIIIKEKIKKIQEKKQEQIVELHDKINK